MAKPRANGLSITMVTRIPLPLAKLVEKEEKKLGTKTAVICAALRTYFKVEEKPAAE